MVQEKVQHGKKIRKAIIGEEQNNTEFTNEQEAVSDIPVRISSTDEYLNLFSAIAQDEMRLYGIPASITLAQGILESNSGKGRLSIEANNHFGIKCHDWTGATIYHDDDTAQERYELYKLDNEVLGNNNRVIKENKSEATFAHVVVKGDTLYSISKRYNLTVKELQDLNALNGTDIKIGQELLVSSK